MNSASERSALASSEDDVPTLPRSNPPDNDDDEVRVSPPPKQSVLLGNNESDDEEASPPVPEHSKKRKADLTPAALLKSGKQQMRSSSSSEEDFAVKHRKLDPDIRPFKPSDRLPPVRKATRLVASHFRAARRKGSVRKLSPAMKRLLSPTRKRRAPSPSLPPGKRPKTKASKKKRGKHKKRKSKHNFKSEVMVSKADLLNDEPASGSSQVRGHSSYRLPTYLSFRMRMTLKTPS